MLTQLLRNQQGRLPNWLGIVIVLIIIVVIAFLVVWMRQPVETPAPNTVQTPPPEVQEFHLVVGTIRAVTKNQIQILVKANNSRLNSDKIYRVNFDNSTVITKRKLPESIKPGERTVIEAEPGDVTELVTNVDVIVKTDVDIARVDEFFATSIELRN